jgi:sulfate/thiosulfate transport system ATP-binding protein
MSIDVQNISKSFGEFRALSGVTLSVPQGKLVALLGPSGSGKTTLLRIIAGLEHADESPASSIRFFGGDVDRQPVRERGVGFVFQHYALFKHMTVFENIAFGLRVMNRRDRPGSGEIHDRVMELIRLVQLEGLHRRFPNQLSGGQRQRVALARALAVKPRVLLLDEPFGALDARVRAELRNWLRRMHDELHITSVFVTHDQEEALEVSDQIVVMNRGRIEQVGTPDDVFHRPATAFVTEFLGNVNLFRGRVESGRAVIQAAGAARIFVRPHELSLSRLAAADAITGRVVRVQSAGSVVKVELHDAVGQPVQVDLSHERFAELMPRVGEMLHATPTRTRVFGEDYSI